MKCSPAELRCSRIADQIRRFNEAQLNSGKVAVQGAFHQFRSRLMITVGLTIVLGFVLAIFSTRKILKLEEHERPSTTRRSAMRGWN